MTDQIKNANSTQPEASSQASGDSIAQDTNLTADSQSVQEQEGSVSDSIASKAISDSKKLGSQIPNMGLEVEIDAQLNRLHRLLSWKEGLKLWTLDDNLNMAYYRLWATEANRLFVRNSVLRKRRKELKFEKKD